MADLKKEDSVVNLPEMQARSRIGMKSNYDEPSLYEAEYDTYRFILSSTGGWTETVRVEKQKDNYEVIAKRFEHVIGHVEITASVQHSEIPEAQWQAIENGLTTNGFWTYPTSIDRMGVDGESWFLEGYKHEENPCTFKNYHGVTRWSPDDSTFIKMCHLLLNLVHPPKTPAP